MSERHESIARELEDIAARLRNGDVREAKLEIEAQPVRDQLLHAGLVTNTDSGYRKLTLEWTFTDAAMGKKDGENGSET